MGISRAQKETEIQDMNARFENDELIVSIYLNPTQFDNKDDFDNYPRQLDKDIKIVERENADVVFAPCTDELYPEGFCTYVTQGKLIDSLCGRLRSGHFNGVTTIVTKRISETLSTN